MDHQKRSSHQVQLDAAIVGPLFMLSAALLFTLVNLFVKLIGPTFTIWDIGFYRFSGGVVLLIAIFGRHQNPYQGHNIRLLIIRGCTGAITFISIVMAIRLLPVSTALVIFYSYPAFSAVFAYLLYGEKIGKYEIVCITGVLLGVGVLIDFQLTNGIFGQIIALISGIFAGLTVTLIRSLREKNGPVIIYLYFCTMGMLITLPMFAMNPVIPATPLEWMMILGIILSSTTGQLLMNQGFFYCKGWEGGVFMSSEVIFTAILGIVFLGDPANWRFWCGGLLIFVCVVVLNRQKANG